MYYIYAPSLLTGGIFLLSDKLNSLWKRSWASYTHAQGQLVYSFFCPIAQMHGSAEISRRANKREYEIIIRQQEPSQENGTKESHGSSCSLAALAFVGVLFAFRFCYKLQNNNGGGNKRERERNHQPKVQLPESNGWGGQLDHQSESTCLYCL